MDNLEQLSLQSVRINDTYGKCMSSSCSGELACLISDTNIVYIYDYANFEKPTIKKFEGKTLNHIYYLAVHDVIFLATNYELILFDRHTQHFNVCYVSDKKIVTFAWNPAETSVVVIDEEDAMFLCNFSTPVFEKQYSSHLNAEVPNSVYVGWGSENTQFQGPKSLQQKVKEKVQLTEVKYSAPKISWRGNGQLFVVNFYKNGQRLIKVFDNQLNSLNMSSEYPNLTDCITFMVAGQCIACSAVSDVNTVIIFEKNCKMKFTFKVPENKGTIKIMRYHPEMNILAIHSLDDKDCSYINIYLHMNGVWSLKQQLCFPSTQKVQDFQWINLHEPLYTICRLVIFTAQSVEHYIFRFIVNRWPNTSKVAVVDGRNILWYNFSEKIIPPPISNDMLMHTVPVNRILFHPQKSLCIILDSLLQLLVVNLKTFDKLLTTESLDLRSSPSFYGIQWNDNAIEVTFEVSDEKISKIFNTSNIILEIKTIKRSSTFDVSHNTNYIKSSNDIGVESSKLIYLSKKGVKLKDNQEELDFALCNNRELYINNQLIDSGVTSFFVFQDYLLLTTASCKLYCVRLLQSSILKLNLEETYSREIEQGARIVTVSNSYPPLITLALPRGNLETIRCRLLTIDVVEELLNENKWKAAVDIIKIERMNWNLLIDLNPTRFSEHIKDFVEAAESCTNLSMIVNDFTNNYDSYKHCFLKKTCDKTDIVKKIINYLTSTDLIGNLLSIVAIQHRHFSLKSALNYVKVVFDLDPHSNESMCKKALQLINNKNNFKNIIEGAYSLYSLDFLTFVFRNSSEDPRIYEHEIATLRSLKPVEMRFKMCLITNNVRDGIKYLLRCDGYDKSFVESFILKHKLEDVAYKSLPPFCVHFEIVSILYANRLSLQQKHDEAALILKQANLISKALEEYKRALDWREVLRIMTALNYDKDEQRKVLYNLSHRLSEANRVDEAVLLLVTYICDYKNGIQLFVEHKEFRKAICLASEHKASEILEELIIPSLNMYMLDLKDKINEHDTNFQKYFNRLQSIRQNKKNKLDNANQGVYEGNDDLYSEIYSTMSSAGSSSHLTSRSRLSQFSSKSKRKEARKKTDLREGGYYEDIALIRALHILYGSVFSLGNEVREVCLILDHNDVRLAKSLHVDLSQLQDTMKNHIPLIWPDVFINTPQIVTNEVHAVVENKIYLDPIFCVPPQTEGLFDAWKLDIFL